MKTKKIFAVLTLLVALLFASISHAADITAIASGSWGDTNVWQDGMVPGTNDDADVEAPYNITVDTNAVVQFIYGSGTVTMAAFSTLEIMDPLGANGTYQLAVLDTSSSSNTVIYSNNPFWAKHQDYCNLVFSNTVTTNLIDFYNGTVNSQDPSNNMTIAGDMTMIGKIKVQQGADFTINGNLRMDTNAQWDCSLASLSVGRDTTLGSGALLLDLDAANGVNNFAGSLAVSASAIGWNISDVTNWVVEGSLTNNGTIVGKGYGSIIFAGTGVITGSKAIKIPTMTVNGTYRIGTTITLTTNTPTLNGTLVFDLARTNQIFLQTFAGTPLFYSGNLNVINSGAPPISGASYKFFNSPNGYGGAFVITSFPPLSSGLSWVDNTLTTGSIDVIGASAGSPILSLSRSGTTLTLSWDSTTFSGYSVQAQTNNGVGTNWSGAGSGTVSPFITAVNPANHAVFFRLFHP